MKLALVHDWLTGMRGGEKVLEALCERFPDAELFTLVHVKGSVSATIERRRIHTSFVQRLPFSARYYRQYLPIFPAAVEHFDFDRFDVVVSVSHCAVKSIVRPGRVAHLCYCLTPMRYAWDQFDQYFGPARIGRMPSAAMKRVMARMARWDRDTADRADRYVAISHHVAGRIRRYYNREATVVYPPVDTDFFHPDRAREGQPFAVIVSALVPYKRIEVAIEACRLARVPLTIAGDGPERARLERCAGAGSNGVTFVGRRSDAEIRDLYRRASVVLMPGEEDFGIVPVEAQACGTPVVALARGGALETVVEGETGSLVQEDDPQAFADAIARTIGRQLDPRAIRAHAERFSRARFVEEMSALIAPTEAAQ
ncbi:MAG TPA: glycosyltransferase [Vicinamibacterales bacterium]|nr:glycosyltransferase [Vicinamibacterales bacterium]